jgi:hypothetical protein
VDISFVLSAVIYNGYMPIFLLNFWTYMAVFFFLRLIKRTVIYIYPLLPSSKKTICIWILHTIDHCDNYDQYNIIIILKWLIIQEFCCKMNIVISFIVFWKLFKWLYNVLKLNRQVQQFSHFCRADLRLVKPFFNRIIF